MVADNFTFGTWWYVVVRTRHGIVNGVRDGYKLAPDFWFGYVLAGDGNDNLMLVRNGS